MRREVRKKETLRAHQNVMNQMLQVIDEICRKHNISYLLLQGRHLVRYGIMDLFPGTMIWIL